MKINHLIFLSAMSLSGLSQASFEALWDKSLWGNDPSNRKTTSPEAGSKLTAEDIWGTYKKFKVSLEEYERITLIAQRNCQDALLLKELEKIKQSLTKQLLFYESSCLNSDSEKPRLHDCVQFMNRPIEFEKALRDLFYFVEGCSSTSSHKTGLSVFKGSVGVPLLVNSYEKEKMQAGVLTSASYQYGPGFNYEGLTSISKAKMSWLFPQSRGYDFSLSSAVMQKQSKNSVQASLEADRELYALRVPGQSTRDVLHHVRSNVELSFPVFSRKAFLDYTFRRRVSQPNVYSGTFHSGAIRLHLDDSVELQRAFSVSYKKFLREKATVIPNYSATRFGLDVKGGLRWGGEGHLFAGFEDRRDTDGHAELYPVFVYKSEGFRTSGWGWMIRRDSTWSPESVGLGLRLFYEPRETFWSSSAQVFEMLGVLDWKWKRWNAPLSLGFRREKNLAGIFGPREDGVFVVELSPVFEVEKNISIESLLGYEQRVVSSARFANEPWSPQRSGHSLKLQAVVHYVW